MTRILVYSPTEFKNMGTVAALMGLIKCLRSYMPDVEITVQSAQVDKDREFAEKLGVKLRQHPWVRQGRMRAILAKSIFLVAFELLRCFLWRLVARFNKRITTPYDQYDVVIHNNADTLSERDYGLAAPLIGFYFLLVGWAIFRRPAATIPTDLGPYHTRLTRWLARFSLNKLDVLALRDEISYQYCRELGLSKPEIYLTADPAFILEPASREKVELILQKEGITKNDKPFIGFSPSWFEMKRFAFSDSVSGAKREGKYIELMAAMIDYVVSRLDATVCFIPHVTGSTVSGAPEDDREVCYRIYECAKNKQALRLLRGNYLPDEIKGIIGTCDMFIGCRMHPAIAATSLGIPTLAIAYGDKFYRIIGKAMGQEQYIVDIRNPSFDGLLAELKSKLDSLAQNRQKIKEELRERTTIIQKQALLYGKVIKELVESSGKTPA